MFYTQEDILGEKKKRNNENRLWRRQAIFNFQCYFYIKPRRKPSESTQFFSNERKKQDERGGENGDELLPNHY